MQDESFELQESSKLGMGIMPLQNGVALEHRIPNTMPEANHFHPTIEVNILHGCEITYSFSGAEVTIPADHLCIFWAAHPHRVTKITGKGSMTIAYISLAEFLNWPLPAEFTNLLLTGAVLASNGERTVDLLSAKRWAAELSFSGAAWSRLRALEMQSRLFRLSLEGWQTLFKPGVNVSEGRISGSSVAQFEKMLRFIATHYAEKIRIDDVAKVGGVTPNHAMSLFRKLLGRSIRDHITDMRMFHAKMLLLETDTKILTIAMDCGYGSLSAFYEAFSKHTGHSPAVFRDVASRPKTEQSGQPSFDIFSQASNQSNDDQN